MRSLFDTEEEEIESKGSEITLSTASLLGIFFGLVLVCGVFFGFGYSMGRGTGTVSKATPVANPTAASEPDEAAAAPVSLKEDAVETKPRMVEPPKEKAAAPVPPKTEPQLVASKPAAGKVVPAYQAPTDAPVLATGQAMVQIAAVSRPQDADVLVAALRQRGYGVVVRSEPQDHLLHVQVGPFANRMQATEIKQKLLSDGYNAIIKQ